MSTSTIERPTEVVNKKVRKTKLLQLIPQGLENSILNDYTFGNTVAQVAKKYGIVVSIVRDFLKENNVLRAVGAPGPNSRQRGRKKTTIDVTPEIVKIAIEKISQGGGLVNIAKEMNVNSQKLSAALVTKGIILTRGRRKSM